MRSWTRQTRCIFCQYRQPPPQCFPTYERQFHVSSSSSSSAAQQKDRLRNPLPRRHDGPRDNTYCKLDAQRSSKDTIPVKDSKRSWGNGRETGTTDKQFKQREVSRALRRLKSLLRTETVNPTSNVTPLQELDPEGTLWPEFESLVYSSTESINGRRSSNSSRRGKLDSIRQLFAQTPEGELVARADLERVIHFAFLDFVLETDTGKLKKSRLPDHMNIKYPTEWYSKTRALQRTIHLHVGPTNSGKTYNALKRLEKAKSGFYAGPLRLLAHEVYSRFNSRGIKCDLVTGDDVRTDDSGEVQLYSSTVEMVDNAKEQDVGVIDEIQMIGDRERGWAWTRALLGARVKELHLCGEARVVPLIRAIVASMGDTLHIHQYERLNPLKVMSRSLKGNLQNLRKGDCVVSFSVMSIHAIKRQIELETGRRCAIIYGSLPPETRAQQAALFNDPDNDYDFLAASDAIGMGLNLSIKRIVFETTRKFNGVDYEQLSIPQIKQIGGRAGRYRTAQDDKQKQTVVNTSPSISTSPSARAQPSPKSIGLVTCLSEEDLPVLRHALASEGTPLKAAGILPAGEFYEDLASRLPRNTPFEYILRRMNDSLATNDRFQICDIRDQLGIARILNAVRGLSIADRLLICASPAPIRGRNSTTLAKILVDVSTAIATNNPITIIDLNELPLEVLDTPMTESRTYLSNLEVLHKCLILFLWLSYRFPRSLRDQPMANRAKELCEEKINIALTRFSANPKLSARLAEMRKTSELLREQARMRGGGGGAAAVADTVTADAGVEGDGSSSVPLTMNPDKSVEEMDEEVLTMHEPSDHSNERDGLEDRIEVEGILDLGEEERGFDHTEHGSDGSGGGNIVINDDEELREQRQQAQGTG